MKIHILIVFIFFNIYSNAQWTKTSGPEGCSPNCFARITTGIICGTPQGLYFSSDEGQTWEAYSVFPFRNIISIITFSDTIVLLLYDEYSINNYIDSVYSSTSFDGGLTWMNPVLVTPIGPRESVFHSLTCSQ